MRGSAKRSAAKTGGRSTQRQGARPARRAARSRNDRNLARRVGWSRRIGVATALVVLVGAGIAFAGGALDKQAGDGTARTTAPRPMAPTLVAPDRALTRLAAIDLEGALPADLDRAGADLLRIFVNDQLVRERGVPDGSSIALNEVPLDEGENEIRAVLVGEGGEGDSSAPVVVIRDSTAPQIRISRPEDGATLYGATETLRGRTESGASLEISDERSNEPVEAVVADDGRFEAFLRLQPGSNTYVLSSEDPAGNRASTRFVVVRETSLASIDLSLSASDLGAAELPATIDVVVLVRDELGRASDGAEVTFGLSPPNRATTTYRTVTENGRAIWHDMVVAGDEGAIGTWLVTVLAVMASGEELRASASFSVE